MNHDAYPQAAAPDDGTAPAAAADELAGYEPAGDGGMRGDGARGTGRAGGYRPGSFRRARLRFRGWRRSRPFWGGLLLILAGLELLQIPLLSVLSHAIKVVIYLGIGGIFGVLIGGLLVACGLLAWFHPVQRVFYAITGVLLSIASFVATNLGGFFLGMLLGVVGASLVFGWAPARQHDGGRHPDGNAPPEPDVGPGTLPGETRAGDPPGRNRLLALPAAPLLLLGMVAAGQAPAVSAPPAAPAGSGCLLPVLPVLCPSPGAGRPAAAASPSASPAVSLLPGPAASPVPAPAATPAPAGRASPSPAGSPNPSAGKRAAAPAVLTAASTPVTLTAGSALMRGLSYDGVANVPTASGGSQQMLKFSMSSLALSGGIVLTATAGGQSMVIRNSGVRFSGNVVLYATRLSGDLLGIPLTFTPQHPPPLVLPVMRFTNVVTGQPLTTASSVQASRLDITGG
jgi:hypothetical protein